MNTMPSAVGGAWQDVYLLPGDIYFGGPESRIITVLGSCVSITLWHPRLRLGGMCHYMLPARNEVDIAKPDGRYADEAMELILRQVRGLGAAPRDFEAKLIGGGCMFCSESRYGDIGQRNIRHGRTLLMRHGFRIMGEHLAGKGHRKVTFDVGTGLVSLYHDEQFAGLRLFTRN